MPYPIICLQLGARDHYAYPRAFDRAGLLVTLVTDYWSANLIVPRQIQPGRAKGRYHADLEKVRVLDFNARTLAKAAWFRLNGLRGWPQILVRNSFFEAAAMKRIPWDQYPSSTTAAAGLIRQKPVLFAYSYAALGLLSRAKSLGWTTILGQIDPGPVEAEVVAAEAARWLDFGPPRQQAPELYWQQWREETALADVIVVNSDWSKTALLKVGVPEEKLHVIPIPFENKETSPCAPKHYPGKFDFSRPLRALFLGRVNHQKGIPALLTAMDAINDSPVELWVGGAEELNIPRHYRKHPRIRWLGKIRRDDVGKFYERADVFLFPTHSDGFGLTQLEAQARKMPLIASKNCGQVVIEGKNGMLLETVTPAAIAGALNFCCQHPQRLAEWSQASGIDAKFSLASVGTKLTALLSETVSTPIVRQESTMVP